MSNKGIYCIINIYNNKIYIGQSSNILKRKKEHFITLKNGYHKNIHLQRAYNKYGKNNFIFKVLMYCDNDELDMYENFFIKIFQATNRDKGYNILEYSTQNPSKTQEVRDKISLWHQNKKETLEQKINISKGMQGTNEYFRVSKRYDKRYKQGFIYTYRYYDTNKKRKQIVATDINKLKEKVLNSNLEWRRL